MSMASVARAAGRGSAIRPVPLRERQPPRQRASGAGRGTGLQPSSTVRSSLADSVLQEQHSQHDRRHRNRRAVKRDDVDREADSYGLGRRTQRRRPAIADWYNSAERAEALETFCVPQTMESEPREETRPFAWRDLNSVTAQLPPGHWAEGYVANVVQSVEKNGALTGGEKERMVNATLQTLSSLSLQDNEDEGRFSDAEE